MMKLLKKDDLVNIKDNFVEQIAGYKVLPYGQASVGVRLSLRARALQVNVAIHTRCESEHLK